MRTLIVSLVAVAALSASSQAASRIVTIAGNGTAEYSGDGGPAVRAGVGGPFGIAQGPDGALYICETINHVVRRLDEQSGKLSTVAGTGRQGYSGDGGPAKAARLNEPYEVRFDTDGNMYFVEMRNHVVRRVDARTGVISTIAGTGRPGFSGDGGPAVEAELNVPHSIAFDGAGNLYVCDIGNHRVRRVDAQTGTISTIAGTGERKRTPDGAPLSGTPLNGPRALDFDKRHSLYLALREGNAVYRIDLKTGTLHHVAGTGEKGYSGDGGDAKRAALSGPKGIALGPEGSIYLADTESHTIRVIGPDGTIATLVGDGHAGNGPDGDPLKCRLNRPHGVFVDARGNVYIGDSSNNVVRKLVVQPAASAAAEADAQPTPAADAAGAPVHWERTQLDAAFRSEGVAVADVNRDGKLDVLAGDVWYQAPEWTMHEIRTPGKFVAGVGYSTSFANFTYDLNADGWDDFILIGFPGEPFHWYENPRNRPGHWKEHLVWHSAGNESPDFEDLTGDGKPELILGSEPERQIGFIPLPEPDKAADKWTFQPVGEPGDPKQNGSFRYYHGLGVGDVNRDGRTDIVIPHGWWEAPEKPGAFPWTFHPHVLSKDGGGSPLPAANIYVDDLDLDGDSDLIMSSAHAYGVWWFENTGGNEQPKFQYRLIDESYSQTHAMEFLDIDGDGQRDIVTGKRYFAHNGSDPGEYEPVVMYWYKTERRKGAPPKFTPHEIVAGRDTGVGTQFVVTDMDGNRTPDIVLSNKKGVNVLWNRGGKTESR